jgi:LysM repeat protein
MIEWKKDSDNQEMEDERYSHLKGQGPGVLGEKSKLPFIIIGVGIICLIILFFVLNPRPPQNKYPDIRPIEARLGQLEERLNRLEALKDQLKKTEDQVRIISETQTLQQELAKTVQINTDTISEIQKKMTAMEFGEKKMEKAASAASPNPQEGSQKVKDAQKTEQVDKDALYHTVQKGETLFRISKKYGISMQKLQEMNKIDAGATIYTGQKLMVGPVKKE